MLALVAFLLVLGQSIKFDLVIRNLSDICQSDLG